MNDSNIKITNFAFNKIFINLSKFLKIIIIRFGCFTYLKSPVAK